MLTDYEESVESYASEQLDEYVKTVKSVYIERGRHVKEREFNDPVWGTLQLSAFEVVILDSPLMQRLRWVRQLGVAHWVYPSALHSRFEHSLGTLHVLKRVTEFSDIGGSVKMGDRHRQLLKLAALTHDIGHCTMSHVSENALDYSVPTEDLINEFAVKYRRELVSLGEINSFLLVRSEAFDRLLHVAQDATTESLLNQNTGDLLSNLILSKRIDPDLPLLQQLISGPFDADKLDYLTRDSFFSGVPQVTDVDRLVTKIRTVTVAQERIPEVTRKLCDESHDPVTVTGIHTSGSRTLDELTLGRALLFDKIYRHHKVRACEVMVASVVTKLMEAATKSGDPNAVALWLLKLSDDQFLNCDFAATFDVGLLTEDAFNFIKSIMRNLRDRKLFVRAIEFSRKMDGDPYDQDEDQALGLRRLIHMAEDGIHRREFCQKVADVAHEALRVTGKLEIVDAWPGELVDYIWLDGVRSAEGLEAPSKALLIRDDHRIVAFDEVAPETPRWATAYQQTRDKAFLFCPLEIVVEVSLAAERVINDEYGVVLPRMSMHAAKYSPSECTEERRLLDSTGFYSHSALVLRPRSEVLSSGDAGAKISRVVNVLQGFRPPFIDPTRGGRDYTQPKAIRNFLSQFEDDETIESALHMLQSMKMIDRDVLVAQVRKFIEANGEFENASLVALGTAGDSSTLATYFAMDSAIDGTNLRVKDLGTAVLEQKPILFVDDFIGSGGQSSSIVAAWMGDHAQAEALNETRTELTDQTRELLRSRRIGFCFGASLNDGPTRLQTELSKWGLENTVIESGIQESELPSIYNFSGIDDSKRTKLIERCREIGFELVSSDDERIKSERSLGYGNDGLLVVFMYNVPAQSLTCLWERGKVAGRQWLPLVPRRKKL